MKLTILVMTSFKSTTKIQVDQNADYYLNSWIFFFVSQTGCSDLGPASRTPILPGPNSRESHPRGRSFFALSRCRLSCMISQIVHKLFSKRRSNVFPKIFLFHNGNSPFVPANGQYLVSLVYKEQLNLIMVLLIQSKKPISICYQQLFA